MRVVAILATYNEARFIGPCLEHLAAQGVAAYVIDNDSTDATVALAEGHRGRGLIGLERLPRGDVVQLQATLARKDVLATTLDADWVMHVDADEFFLPPVGGTTLAAAIADVDAAGYTALDAQEFTFVPTREAPDHGHAGFLRTMRAYYPFRPHSPFAIRAWKRQAERVGLAEHGGHRIDFPGFRLCPRPLRFRHYQFLSVAHAIEKYVRRRYDPAAIARGWHQWRGALSPEMIVLPRARELRRYVGDERLDPTEPRITHVLAEAWLARRSNHLI